MEFKDITRIIFLLVILILSVYFIYLNKVKETKPNVTSIDYFYEDATGPTGPSGPSDTCEVDDETSLKKCDPEPKLLPDKCPQMNSKEKIIKAYQELFQRTPVDEEVNFYLDYFRTQNLTDQQLFDIIATTAPILKKTIPSHKQIIYGTEDEVILAFNQVLNRNPDKEELQRYAKMMTDRKNFNTDKLIQILASSDEYIRFERMQSNTANGTLLGGVTDRQITMTVEDMYAEITGKQVDMETLKFLKKKFVDYNLDEEKMKLFIKYFVRGDIITSELSVTNEVSGVSESKEASKVSEKGTVKSETNQAVVVTEEEYSSSSSKSFTYTKGSDCKTFGCPEGKECTSSSDCANGLSCVNKTCTKNDPFKKVVTEKFTNSNPNCYSEKCPEFIKTNYVFINNPNKTIMNDLMGFKENEEYEIDSQSVLDTIYREGTCVFNVGKESTNTSSIINKHINKSETRMADEIFNRNMNELKYSCNRNSIAA